MHKWEKDIIFLNKYIKFQGNINEESGWINKCCFIKDMWNMSMKCINNRGSIYRYVRAFKNIS